MTYGIDYLRLDELYDEMETLRPAVDNWTEIVNARQAEERRDEYPGLEDISRLNKLEALFGELGEEARHETAIRESDFEEYAEEFAEDIGAIDREHNWPNYCIDWERAARDLAMDYTSFDFEGVSYLVRLS
jgi:hypothetical protein